MPYFEQNVARVSPECRLMSPECRLKWQSRDLHALAETLLPVRVNIYPSPRLWFRFSSNIEHGQKRLINGQSEPVVQLPIIR